MRRSFRTALLSACALLLLGCAERGGAAASGSAEPRRVVVLAPAAAEMLDALGLADRVVGIGEHGPWPAAVADRPVVGGYDAPSAERLLELGADALITSASRAGSPAHERIAALGVRVLALDTSTFDGVFSGLAELGRAFGRDAAAAEIAARVRGELAAIERRAAGLPRRDVLVVVGRDPLFVAGPGSHLDELIRLVGGTNAAADALAPYQQVSLEAMLERRPEVIVDCSDNRPGAWRDPAASDWARWSFLPAVRDGRVHHVDPGRLVIPGLRLPEMARLLGRLVHPEVFGEPAPAEPAR